MNYEGGVPGAAQGDELLDGDFGTMGNCTLLCVARWWAFRPANSGDAVGSKAPGFQ